DDGNACTTGEACHGGVCSGGTAKTCTGAPGDACHLAAACDPSSGACVNPPAPDGTLCNDSNACTRGDRCQAGACVSGPPVVCVAPDACHAPGTCQPATGVCTNPVLTGTTCQLGDQFDYDKAGRLIRDRGALLGYDAYDQLRSVTAAPQPPPQLAAPRI